MSAQDIVLIQVNGVKINCFLVFFQKKEKMQSKSAKDISTHFLNHRSPLKPFLHPLC